MTQSLRRRIEQSTLLAEVMGRPGAAWGRFCYRTTHWTREGEPEIAAALRDGPVIVLAWHEMVMLAGLHWRQDWGRLATLHDESPVGRAGAVAGRRTGTTPFVIASKASNMSIARDVLGLIRGGASLAMMADGPRGPGRRVGDATFEWVRAAGVPVFTYGWSIAGARRLNNWDKMILPKPFAAGGVVFRRWPRDMPRRPDDATRDALRADLGAQLTATAAAADALAQVSLQRGRQP
jgi:lysophospholipid acyltransferase (LPLAT)-like uncharacterized protein